jgi:hypothetical protein
LGGWCSHPRPSVLNEMKEQMTEILLTKKQIETLAEVADFGTAPEALNLDYKPLDGASEAPISLSHDDWNTLVVIGYNYADWVGDIGRGITSWRVRNTLRYVRSQLYPR